MMNVRPLSRTQKRMLLLLGAFVFSITLVAVPVGSTGFNNAGAGADSISLAKKSQNAPGAGSAAVGLSAETKSVSESDGFALINVVRTGDLSAGATVDYATLDGTAGQRTRYEIAGGTIRFAPGEATKSIQLLVNDNNYIDGSQTFYLSLSNPSGAALGLPSLSTITVHDDDSIPASVNILEDPHTFVRQQYYDFLSRYPDQAGWDFWTGQITACGTDALCLHNKRLAPVISPVSTASESTSRMPSSMN